LSLLPEIKIELEQPHGGDLHIKFNSETMGDLVVKKAGVPKEKMGGEARQLLAASLAECMLSTFASLLDWARVKYSKLRADVTVSTEKDEKGRLCVGQINVNIEVETPDDEESQKRLKRAEALFKRGCLMSRSIERGIKVSYAVNTKSLHS
jgi:organic hydroperoxide reductase OsmC/OhrA